MKPKQEKTKACNADCLINSSRAFVITIKLVQLFIVKGFDKANLLREAGLSTK